MKESPKIFISYAREDREQAERVYEKLFESGFVPWMDSKNIVGGEDWEKSIWRAVIDSDFFIVCLSRKSVIKRGFLQKEIRKAIDIWNEKLDDDIYLIPLKLEECNVPQALNKVQWISLFEKDGFDLLINALNIGVERASNGQSEIISSGEPSFTTKEINESDVANLAYDLITRFPVFKSIENDSEHEINTVIEGYILNSIQSFRADSLSTLDSPAITSIKEKDKNLLDDLYISFDVVLISSHLISIQFIIFRYFSGAAHPQHHTKCFNFRLNPITQLSLQDIFSNILEGIEVVSRYCSKDLQKQNTGEQYPDGEIYRKRQQEWIVEGTSPEEENFSTFSLLSDGLNIIFDPYHVGPYSWGTREVLIPWQVLKEFLEPRFSELPIINGNF